MSLERGGEMSRVGKTFPGEDDVGLAAGPDSMQSLGTLEECLNPLSHMSDQLY